MSANEAIINGVASILRDASAALARLGTLAAQQQPQDPSSQPSGANPDGGTGVSLADAAAALVQVASQFAGGAGTASAGASEPYGNESYGNETDGAEATEAEATDADAGDASMSTVDFVSVHRLESWVGEALDLLTPRQRATVMDPPLDAGRGRNKEGIVVSRIKEAVPLDQRLGIFVQINGLSDGVVDRISTLTPDQAEAMMESGLKIQKATNPSGVAMRRISDVLNNEKQNPSATRTLPSVPRLWEGTASQRAERSRTPVPTTGRTSSSEVPDDIQRFVNELGLEWWCGEVLKRLSLYQRQQVMKDVDNMASTRNPSGVVMSRVRQIAVISELLSIFIDINGFDNSVQQELWALTPEQQNAVISPGIFLQNVRNPSTAVRSRIKNVLAGNDAFGKPLNPA